MNFLDCPEKDGRDWNAATEEERREFCALAAKSPLACGVVYGNKIYRALDAFYDTEQPCLLTTQIQTVLGLVISTEIQTDRVRVNSTAFLTSILSR